MTISAPLAVRASRMASGDENFPVPMMSREQNVRPAMVSGLDDKDIPTSLGKNHRLSRREERFVCVNVETWAVEI